MNIRIYSHCLKDANEYLNMQTNIRIFEPDLRKERQAVTRQNWRNCFTESRVSSVILDKYLNSGPNSVILVQKFLPTSFCFLERGSQDPQLFPGVILNKMINYIKENNVLCYITYIITTTKSIVVALLQIMQFSHHILCFRFHSQYKLLIA